MEVSSALRAEAMLMLQLPVLILPARFAALLMTRLVLKTLTVARLAVTNLPSDEKALRCRRCWSVSNFRASLPAPAHRVHPSRAVHLTSARWDPRWSRRHGEATIPQPSPRTHSVMWDTRSGHCESSAHQTGFSNEHGATLPNHGSVRVPSLKNQV